MCMTIGCNPQINFSSLFWQLEILLYIKTIFLGKTSCLMALKKGLISSSRLTG